MVIKIFILIFFALSHQAAMAKMATMTFVDVNDVISYFENNKSTESESPTVLQWAVFAKDTMGLEKLYMYSRIGPEKVSSQIIVDAIKTHITSTQWQLVKDAKIKNTLSEWRATLENRFGAESYSWAWVVYQLGDLEASKKILQPLFEAEYVRVMNLKEALYGFRGGPLVEIERLEKALILVSADKEQADLSKKVKKAKIHVANLPESHIVT